MEGVGALVVRDFPGFGQRGLQLILGVAVDQPRIEQSVDLDIP
jgi:hypothetical protein